MSCIQNMKTKIENFTTDKHVEIFKIFKKHKVVYTENKNGIFINLNHVDENVLQEIEQYIDYIQKQDNILQTVENEKTTLEQQFEM